MTEEEAQSIKVGSVIYSQDRKVFGVVLKVMRKESFGEHIAEVQWSPPDSKRTYVKLKEYKKQ